MYRIPAACLPSSHQCCRIEPPSELSPPPFFYTPTDLSTRARSALESASGNHRSEGGKAGPAGVASPLLVVGVGERRPPAFINSSFGVRVFSLRKVVVVGVKADYISWRGWYRQSHRQSMTAPPLLSPAQWSLYGLRPSRVQVALDQSIYRPLVPPSLSPRR